MRAAESDETVDRAGRLKQWLNYLRQRYPEGQAAFDDVRISNDPDHMAAWLRAQGAWPAIRGQEPLDTQAPRVARPAEFALPC